MAEPITIQKLIEASMDSDSFEVLVNGDENAQVTTRLGETYPSAKKAIKTLFENGGIADRFETVAELENSDLTDGEYALVADDVADKNGIYIKDGGVWSLAKYNPLNDSREYLKRVAEKVELIDSTDFLEAHLDKDGNAYKYTDTDGYQYLTNLDGSVQDNINTLNASQSRIPTHDDKPSLTAFADKTDSVYAEFDADANLRLSNDIYLHKISGEIGLTDKLNSINNTSKHLSILAEQPKIKQLTPIAEHTTDDPLNKRMPYAIRTNYGFLLMHHKQIAGYNGDSKGSQLWKAVIDMDSNYNLTVRSHELFIDPLKPWGVIKHPTFGRTTDNRIVLLYERGGETDNESDPLSYKQYIRYSSDEGLTFTVEQPLNITNLGEQSGEGNRILGTTGRVHRIGNHLFATMYVSPSNKCYLIHSYDDGATWKEGEVVMGYRGHEPQVAVLDDKLLMTVRGSQDLRKWYAYSYDEGLTWDWQGYMDLKAPNNQAAIYYDSKIGAVIHAHNNMSTGVERKKYSVSLSFDDGKTYGYTHQLYADSWFGGYSQIIKISEGVYAIIIEFSENISGTFNANESTGIIILSLSEVVANVSFN